MIMIPYDITFNNLSTPRICTLGPVVPCCSSYILTEEYRTSSKLKLGFSSLLGVSFATIAFLNLLFQILWPNPQSLF